MPLDRQANAVLQGFQHAGRRPLHAMTPFQARLAAWTFKYLGGPPEPVASIRRRLIRTDGALLPIRIYRPLVRSAAPLPAIVYFHGGGFVLGNLEICDSFSRALANRTGCIVVAVAYRRAPEHKFPVPLEDCYRATAWVFEHSADLGIDRSRIGVVGDSSGGNLAAAVTLRARDAQGPRLAYQVLIYPAVQYGWETDSAVRHAEGLALERADMKYFWNHYVRTPADGHDPYCSPLLAESHAGLPPALIVCAEYDPLLDDGRRYAARLEASGVPVKLSVYEGMIHGFLWMAGRVDRAHDALDEIGREARGAFASAKRRRADCTVAPCRRASGPGAQMS